MYYHNTLFTTDIYRVICMSIEGVLCLLKYRLLYKEKSNSMVQWLILSHLNKNILG